MNNINIRTLPEDSTLLGIHLWKWDGDDGSSGSLISIGFIFLTIDIYL